MPNIKSAMKRAKQNTQRANANAQIQSKLKTQFKKIITMLDEKKAEDAKKEIDSFYKIIDKAAGKGVVKKNYAARNKSKLSKKLNILSKS